MPSINTLFPSRFLKAGTDIAMDGTAVLTIDNVKTDTVGQGEEAEVKPIVYFRETPKGLVLNKINAASITKALGSDDYLVQWPGKRITIVATEVQYGKDRMPGLRVRITPPSKDAKPGLPDATAAAVVEM